MAADSPIPLATSADMLSGQFADLCRDYDLSNLDQTMIDATRICEGNAGRRLAPFTGVPESHRATGVDPDEASDSNGIPVSMQTTLSTSYANALGGSGNMVRHVWLNECAPRYPEMWTYSDLSVQVFLSIGGSQTYPGVQIIGAEPDSGHIWFHLGSFVPAGSLIRVIYGGGYTTVPADLARACKLTAATLILAEIDPEGTNYSHNPGALTAMAEKICSRYQPT